MQSSNTKHRILHLLSQARGAGEPVSGAALADALGISRNAVWKAIVSLREEGCAIVSLQSRGYILDAPLDLLSEEGIRSRLPEDLREVIRVRVHDRIDSTNSEARLLAAAGQDSAPVLITAEEQTGGRGRYGRSFWSPRGSGIYMTYSFRPEFPLSDVTRVTTIAAVAAHRVLSRYSSSPLGIKWVNDLYRDGLKICGILTESEGSLESGNFDRIIVGIGINCVPAAVPEELRGIAGALTEEAEPGFTRDEIIAGITAELHRSLTGRSRLNDPEILRYYREHCFLIGREITVRPAGREPYPAEAVGITEDFALVVRAGNETRELTGGEVSIRI